MCADGERDICIMNPNGTLTYHLICNIKYVIIYNVRSFPQDMSTCQPTLEWTILSSLKTKHSNFTSVHFVSQHHGLLRVADSHCFFTLPAQLLYLTTIATFSRDRYPPSIFSELSARRKITCVRERKVCKRVAKQTAVVTEEGLDSGR